LATVVPAVFFTSPQSPGVSMVVTLKKLWLLQPAHTKGGVCTGIAPGAGAAFRLTNPEMFLTVSPPKLAP
jgi:hypothetical protein